MPNPTADYNDYVIRDISASYAQQNQFVTKQTVGYLPVVQTIDGPLSIKGASVPYSLTISKIKES